MTVVEVKVPLTIRDSDLPLNSIHKRAYQIISQSFLQEDNKVMSFKSQKGKLSHIRKFL